MALYRGEAPSTAAFHNKASGPFTIFTASAAWRGENSVRRKVRKRRTREVRAAFFAAADNTLSLNMGGGVSIARPTDTISRDSPGFSARGGVRGAWLAGSPIGSIFTTIRESADLTEAGEESEAGEAAAIAGVNALAAPRKAEAAAVGLLKADPRLSCTALTCSRIACRHTGSSRAGIASAELIKASACLSWAALLRLRIASRRACSIRRFNSVA